MDDRQIIELFFARSEEALEKTQAKYGKYCFYIAKNILGSDEDAKECTNDAYLCAWNSIPPHRPEKLSAFLGKLTRNLALNRLEKQNAKKRAYGTQLILEELEECIPSEQADAVNEIVLRDALNSFLSSLPSLTRTVFVKRYWYMASIREIANDCGIGESRVKVTLMRTRLKLKEYLEKEGINV